MQLQMHTADVHHLKLLPANLFSPLLSRKHSQAASRKFSAVLLQNAAAHTMSQALRALSAMCCQQHRLTPLSGNLLAVVFPRVFPAWQLEPRHT